MLKSIQLLLRKALYDLQIAFYGLRKISKIQTHLTSQEKKILFTLASSVSSGIALEIGSFIGASSCFIAAGLKNGKLLCVDTWENDAMSEGARDTWGEFAVNTSPYGSIITPIRGFSIKVIDKVENILGEKKLHLLFIDGDHSYEGVKADWDLYKRFLGEKSIVVFHDWGWAEGVKKLITEEVGVVTVDQHSSPNMWWARTITEFKHINSSNK